MVHRDCGSRAITGAAGRKCHFWDGLGLQERGWCLGEPLSQPCRCCSGFSCTLQGLKEHSLERDNTAKAGLVNGHN